MLRFSVIHASNRRVAPLVMALLGVLLGGASPARAAEPSPAPIWRDEAVALARQGRFDEALPALRALHAADPSNAALLGDLVTVLDWAGEDAEAVERARGLDLDAAPAYVAEAAARALRDLGRFEESAALYRRAAERFPDRWQGRLGAAVTLAEAGRRDEALAAALPLVESFPQEVEVLLGAAYVRRLRGEPLEAVGLYDRALTIDPGHAEAFRLRVLSIADLGAPHLALDEAGRRPDAFTGADLRRLRGDRAAAAVRWGELPPASEATPEERFAGTDRALALLDANLAAASEGGTESADALRARFDRIVALRDRARMEEVSEEVERLEAAGVELPPYVQEAAGDAALTLRRPREAAERYRRVLASQGVASGPSPGSYNARLALFYALLEGEDLRAALELIDQLAAEQPAWRSRAGLRSAQGNPRKAEGDRTAAMARAFTDLLREAQERLEPRVDRAPFDVESRLALATVYRWRGWPERAVEEYELALALDPENLGGRIGRAATLMDLGRLDDRLGESIAGLAARYPENLHVGSLAREWELRHDWQLTTEATGGDSSGDQLGTRDARVDAFLFASPLGHRTRPYAHAFYESAEFPEGEASYERLGIGVESRLGRFRFAGEVHGNRPGFEIEDPVEEAGTEAGVTLDLGWRPDDRWSLGLRVDTFSTEVPLRARRSSPGGVDGESARLSLGYRWSDLASAGAGAGLLDMSDGNERRSAFAFLAGRLLTRPRGRIEGSLDLYASDNTLEGAPYFNPERDLSATGTLVFDLLGWRRYGRSLTHRLVATGGVYDQRGFGVEPVATFRYEHDWRLTPAFGLRYGVGWASRAFDGEREERTWGYASTDWRF